jgi:2-polyprenyl-3-methyl-5-hydroxy-6-metoxy-1,4-benzoquinol methylase
MNEKNIEYIISKSNEAWEKLSHWWDKEIGEGDLFHRLLVFPTMLEFINPKQGDEILDIACGNGALTRRLFAHDANVLGIDVSETFIKQARARSVKKIKYKQLDATSSEKLHGLAKQQLFNKAVCSMALHDLPVIIPLIQALPSLLNPDGCFVFSIPHPCFNMGDMQLELMSGHPKISRSHYIKPEHIEMKSKPNQPINQHCFHRSLTDIFQALFSVGMVLDALKEPAMCDVTENLDNTEFGWKHLPEIPPVLICRWIFKS